MADKYSMKQVDIPRVKLNERDIVSAEEKEIRRIRHEQLKELGVYVALYVDESFQFPEHPDGIHNYIEDANLAEKLIMSGAQIPDDLKERLLFYKSLNWLPN